MDYSKNNNSIPQVPILRNVGGPVNPGGAHPVYQISLTNILAEAEECTEYIESNNSIPDYLTVTPIDPQVATDFDSPSMFSIFVRIINYYGVRGIMPNLATVRAVNEPSVWPVELTSFTATTINDNVILNWQTATETNNFGFEIERLQTGKNQNTHWLVIGFIEGNGNSNSAKHYSFTDDSFSKDENKIQYRLRQIDNDGKYEYSNIIEITLSVNPEKFLLSQNFPNPFNPSTKIEFSLMYDSHVELKIFSSLGEEITTLINGSQVAGRHTVVWNAADYPTGLYLYKMQISPQTISGSEKSYYSFQKKMVLVK